MKKTLSVSAIILLSVIAYSCSKKAEQPASGSYLDLPAQPYPYNTGTKGTTAAHRATLGRVLFYDTHLSISNSVACASCHKQELGFADNEAFSKGFEGKRTLRNSKSIVNLAGDNIQAGSINEDRFSLFWDGREQKLSNLVALPILNHIEMGLDTNDLPGKLSALPYYRDLFVNAYGDNTITMARISESVAMFLVAIQSTNTRFDQSLVKKIKLEPLEEEGRILFQTKYNCERCHSFHSGFYSSSSSAAFMDIGLDNTYSDKGRSVVTGSSTDDGKFKVPSLRNVALTAPYMHDGRYKTLGDVIDHYSSGINNSVNLDKSFQNSSGNVMQMNISDHDKEALIAFLHTLTDYNMIADEKFANPFKVKQ